MKLDFWLKKFISFLFATLFFLVPLFFTPFNSELFEFNKIILVYAFTVLIVGSWLGRMVCQGKILFKRTPFDFPLLLFLVSQIISTFFSIDRHTSLWGYYSRFNGGLLSTVSYLLLFWAFVANCEIKDVFKIIKTSFAAAFLVSIYGILEHFGHSFSCLLFEGKFGVECWVQDVQARVFATLGQPNWLAAYLAILIPLSIFKIVEKATKKTFSFIFNYLLSSLLFACLLFTRSRSGFLGLVLALIFFWLIIFFKKRQQFKNLLSSFLLINAIYFILIVFFGSPFAQVNRFLPFHQKPPATSPTGTQLESGGTESGKIRQIVWQGAWEIFRHYPLFGTGVETFAYSYYNFRPVAHNLVSEWDFLYNKAHNEYLNYLSTTGIIGLGTYLLFIGWFVVWSIKKLKTQNSKLKTLWSNSKIRNEQSSTLNCNFEFYLLNFALLCGWLSILVSNFFGFSVVLISLYFYLIPAFVFIPYSSSPTSNTRLSPPPLTFLRKIFLIFWLFAICYLLSTILNLWRADYFYSLSQKLNKQNQPWLAYQNITKAITISPNEPVFINEMASTVTSLAILSSTQKDASAAAQLAKSALNLSDQALKISPANLNFWKTRVRICYQLSFLDSQYLTQAIESLQKAIKLAPTDPKLLYNLGLLYAQKNPQEGLAYLEKAIELKPNYEEARNTLALFYEELGLKEKALEQLQIILQSKGSDPEIESRIEKLKK